MLFSGHAPAQPADLAMFGWLAGVWEMTRDGSRIEYRRAADGALEAKVFGSQSGKPFVLEYRYTRRRKPGPPVHAPPPAHVLR